MFHKRATKYRSLSRKMTYKDKGSYKASPTCRDRGKPTCRTYAWVMSWDREIETDTWYMSKYAHNMALNEQHMTHGVMSYVLCCVVQCAAVCCSVLQRETNNTWLMESCHTWDRDRDKRDIFHRWIEFIWGSLMYMSLSPCIPSLHLMTWLIDKRDIFHMTHSDMKYVSFVYESCYN